METDDGPRTADEIRADQSFRDLFSGEKLSEQDRATLAADAHQRAIDLANADDGRDDRRHFEESAVKKLGNTAIQNIDPNDRSITRLGKKAAAAKAKELGLSIPGDEGGQALSRAIRDVQGLQNIAQDLDSAAAATRSKQRAQDYLTSVGYPAYDKDTAVDILNQKIREAKVGIGVSRFAQGGQVGQTPRFERMMKSRGM